MCKEICYKELAHTATEAEKSQQSAGWRPRGTNDESSSPRAGQLTNEEESMSQMKFKGEKKLTSELSGVRQKFPLTQERIRLFLLFRPSAGRMRPAHIRRAACFPQQSGSSTNTLQTHPDGCVTE